LIERNKMSFSQEHMRSSNKVPIGSVYQIYLIVRNIT